MSLNRQGRREVLQALRRNHPSAIRSLAALPSPDRVQLLREAYAHAGNFVTGPALPVTDRQVWRSDFEGIVKIKASERPTWFADCLIAAAPQLRQFIAAREDFTRFVLLGQWPEAKRTLDSIQSQFGTSLWLRAARIGLSAASEGAESAFITAEAFPSTNPMIDWLVDRFAEFSSPDLAFRSKLENMEQQLATISYPEFSGFTYLLVAPNAIGETSAKFDLQYLLHAAWGFSIVDRLVCFERALQLAVSLGTASIRPDTVVRLRVENLITPALAAALLSDISAETVDTSAADVADLYTQGMYAEAIGAIETLLPGQPANIALAEMYVSALERTDQLVRSRVNPFLSANAPLTSILEMLYEGAIKPSRAVAGHLRQTGITLLATTVGMRLLAAAAKADPAIDSSIDENVMGAATSTRLSPKALSTRFPKRAEVSLLPQLPIALKQRPSFRLFAFAEGFDTLPERLPRYRAAKYRALREIRDHNYDTARTLLVRLINEPATPDADRRDAIKLLWKVAMATQQAGTAADVLAWGAAHESEFVTERRIERVYSLAKGRPPQSSTNPFAWALLCERRQRLQDTEESRAALQFAFDHTLRCLGISKPSQEFELAEPHHLPSYAAFLRDVCKPEVMDSSILDLAMSADAVERERIAVLQLLRQLDPQHESQYVDELTSTTKALATRDALRHAEQNKVHVNPETISKLAFTRLSDDLETCKTLRAVDAVLKEQGKRRKPAAGESEPQFLLVVGQVGIPYSTDLGKSYFRSFFQKLVELYTTDPDHGLDRYLGLRVRHGFFANHTRAPFDTSKLVSRRDGAGDYWQNQHWKKVWSDVDPAVAEQALEALTRLSAAVDDIIERTRPRLCRVRTHDNPDSLFDYSFETAAVDSLWDSLPRDVSAVELVEVVMAAIEGRTRDNLARVRDALREDVEAQLVSALESLRHTCQGLGLEGSIVNSIAECRTACTHEIRNMQKWFSSEGSHSYEDYRLSLVVDAAVDVIRAQHPGLSRPVTEAHIDPVLTGSSLIHLLDALSIVVHNAAKYSGALTDSTATVTISPKLSSDGLTLLVENSLPPEAVSGLALRLAELNSRIHHGQRERELRDRGGSGLARLHRILTNDLGVPAGRSGLQLEGDKCLAYLFIPMAKLVSHAQ